jgi:hypothetical protein
VDGRIHGFGEKIYAYRKNNRIDDSRHDNPFPQFVLLDEFMGPEIGLNRYDEFFQQNVLCQPAKYTNDLSSPKLNRWKKIQFPAPDHIGL